jgi:hypothetical protein
LDDEREQCSLTENDILDFEAFVFAHKVLSQKDENK